MQKTITITHRNREAKRVLVAHRFARQLKAVCARTGDTQRSRATTTDRSACRINSLPGKRRQSERGDGDNTRPVGVGDKDVPRQQRAVILLAPATTTTTTMRSAGQMQPRAANQVNCGVKRSVRRMTVRVIG